LPQTPAQTQPTPPPLLQPLNEDQVVRDSFVAHQEDEDGRLFWMESG